MQRFSIIIFLTLAAFTMVGEGVPANSGLSTQTEITNAPQNMTASPQSTASRSLLLQPVLASANSPSKSMLKSAGTPSSLLSLSPGPVGGLGGFLNSIGSTGHSLSFSVASNGSSTGYNAMYNHNLFYDMGKYGRFDMNIGAGKAGDYKGAAYLYLKPSVDYRLQSDNFLLNVHVDVPPAVKNQTFGR